MDEATVELETPAKYADGVQDMLASFRGDADRRLKRIELGEEPASLEDIKYERDTARLAEPLIAQGMEQAGGTSITYNGDAQLLSNALDFRGGHLGEELGNVLGTSPVEYDLVPDLLEEIAWLNRESKRIDSAYREKAVA